MTYHVLIVRRQLRWDSSPDDGGRYDLTGACPRCGAGATRIDPLFASTSMCKEGVAATYKLQVVVSKSVVERLSAVGVRSLRQLVEKKSRAPIDFWSLEPEAHLQRWASASAGYAIEGQCSLCHRDGHFDRAHLPLSLVYDSMPSGDVFATWELFGNSCLRSPLEQSLFAVPRLVVSDRVREILAGYRGIEFFQVQANEPNQALEPTATAVTDRAAHAPRQP
jgi:hypothetical protein